MFNASRSIAAISTLVVAFAVSTTRASAQSVSQAGAPVVRSCERDFSAPGAYKDCALTLSKLRLERDGVLVGRASAFHPIGLTQFVVGDSARRYARSYERQTKWAMVLEYVGAGFAISPLIASRFHSCRTPSCPARPRLAGIDVGAIVGVSLISIGIPLQIHGRHQGYKAVEFYNASLGR